MGFSNGNPDYPKNPVNWLWIAVDKLGIMG